MDVGTTVDWVCLRCARRIGSFLRDRAGHATVWNFEREGRGHVVKATPSGDVAKLLAEEIAALRERPGQLRAALDGPPTPPTLQELLETARFELDIEPRASLKTAAQVLVSEEATPKHLRLALQIVLNVRILRPGSLDALRRVLFPD